MEIDDTPELSNLTEQVKRKGMSVASDFQTLSRINWNAGWKEENFG